MHFYKLIYLSAGMASLKLLSSQNTEKGFSLNYLSIVLGNNVLAKNSGNLQMTLKIVPRLFIFVGMLWLSLPICAP